MSGIQLLISFMVTTFAWQFIAETIGPRFGELLFKWHIQRLQDFGMSFLDQAAMERWVSKTANRSVNIALVILAAVFGAFAGLLNFPLIGFSRSLNFWSWLRILVLIGSSWLMASIVWGSTF